LRKINEQILDNTVAGQTFEITNVNFNIQLNKISNKNIKDLFILDERFNKNIFKKSQNSYGRIIQIRNNTDNCDDSMTFCLPNNILKQILEKENSENLGFNSQLNKNKNVAIKTNNTRKIFSENSLDFELKVDDSKFKSFRNLDLKDLNVNFNIRLKLPDLKNYTSDIGDSLCVQYEKNNQEAPSVLCSTWYDYLSNEVVCECQKQGLTINLMDSQMSQIGIFKQFEISKINFCIFYNFILFNSNFFHWVKNIFLNFIYNFKFFKVNIYSLTTISVLLICFLICLIISCIIDRKEKLKNFMKSKHFDIVQYYLVIFIKENFNKGFTFYKLYIHLIKVSYFLLLNYLIY